MGKFASFLENLGAKRVTISVFLFFSFLALYQSVCGVGLLTTATSLAYVPELGHGLGQGVIALVGLVWWIGQWVHLRHRALYMAALR